MIQGRENICPRINHLNEAFQCQVLTLTSVPTLKLTSVNRALFLAYQIRFDKFIALSRFP